MFWKRSKAQVLEITAGAGVVPCEDDMGRVAAAAGRVRETGSASAFEVRVTLQFKV